MLYWSNSKKVHTLPIDVYSGGPIPHNMAQTFDGPTTIKRSGSEHRRAVTFSLFGQERGLVRDMELSLQERRRGRKKPFLMLKKVSVPCKGNRKGRKDY